VIFVVGDNEAKETGTDHHRHRHRHFSYNYHYSHCPSNKKFQRASPLNNLNNFSSH